MPTYVYKFVDTGETIEIQQAFTDDALTEAAHPADGMMRPVRKVFTPVGITFKGNGFYKTDSRGKTKAASSSTSSSSDSSGSTSTSSTSTDSSSSGSSSSGDSGSSTSSSSTGHTHSHGSHSHTH